MSWPSRPRSSNASAPSPDRCPRHLFLFSLGGAPGELVAREIAVFITGHALITVRKDTGPGHADRRLWASLAVRMSAAWAGARAGGCHVHGGLGGAFGGTGGNHQQCDRFPAGCGHADRVAGNGGEPVDPDDLARIGSEPVRDFVPVVAVDGQPLHPDAGLGVQRRDEAGQLGKRVPGMRPPASVGRAGPVERGVEADSRRWRPGHDRGRSTHGAARRDGGGPGPARGAVG